MQHFYHPLMLSDMNEIFNFKNLITLAFRDLLKNKLRTLLTSLGILIGIFSVVILNSLGLGLKKYIYDQFQSLGTNLVMIMPGKAFSGGNFRATSSYQMTSIFDEEDLELIKKNFRTKVAAPAFVKYLQFKGERDSKIYETILTNEDIFAVFNSKLDQGSFFTRADVNKKTKIVVLGANAAEILYGSAQNAVGKKVKIDNQSFKIIGVLAPQGTGSAGMESIDDHVYLPYKASSSFNPEKKFLSIYAKSSDTGNLSEYKQLITDLLLKKYDTDDFSVLDQKEILTTFTSIFNIINIVLVAIAAISLIVGGIGIMNIMFISVVQRIKEIGIRRAYGATKKDILLLFITQTLILSLFGGVMGLLLSYLAVLIIQNYFPVYIDLQTVVIALVMSLGTGLVFGVLPAVRAARLTPVEAIRKD